MYKKRLYDELLKLTEEESSPFYFSDHLFEGMEFRIFNYRLANYSAFMKLLALECRGHTFEKLGDSYVLSSLPMQKFFNVNENPLTQNLDFSQVTHIYEKLDGSLISSVNSSKGCVLKSKGSFTSEHAIAARKLLEENSELNNFVEAQTSLDRTVNMEYTSNNHRIVLPYYTAQLRILNVRDNNTGEYIPEETFGLSEELIAKNIINEVDDYVNFVDNISNMKGIEGFVIRLKDGTMVKCKTDEYVSLHHAKDSVTSPRRLMEVVLQEASDDLRQMFSDDQQALAEIENMETFVAGTVNHLVKPVDAFYTENKHLERKEFAIKGQQELRKDQFSLAMGKYSGKEINYKEFISRNYKDYLTKYKTLLTVIND